jgi:YqjK-like protein
MSSRKAYLLQRREWLVMQAADQRSEISYLASELQGSFRWVDMGIAVVQALRTHPRMAIAGSSLLLRVSNSKRLLWAGRLFTAWELFNVVRTQWRTLQVTKR